MGEVSESECGSAEVFETAVDRFGRTVAGVGVVEVGQDVPGSTFECPAQCDDLCEGAWHVRVAETVYFGLHQSLTRTRVGRPVGVDNVLVDAPGDLEGDVLVAGKQVEYLVLLA